MTLSMDWKKLLSSKRLGRDKAAEGANRSSFQRDFDRIIFSSAFRRLQDKTQVHPLSESDYVRTRLTHSLETSCVGRSLGEIIGKEISLKNNLDVHSSEFGSIVASACLAHDIGNPPLGHSGEDAISHWFKHSVKGKEIIRTLSDREQQEFKNFEGNAQGFRVLARLQSPDNYGGMQLTCATLATYAKYPREIYFAGDMKDVKRKSAKKYGFFQEDKELFSEVAAEVGLIPIQENLAWCRHPLAFLVEAADDITYSIIDFEDGFRLGYITYDEVYEVLSVFINEDGVKQLENIKDFKERIEYLRAKTINELILQTAQVFIDNQDAIMTGQFDEDLISKIGNYTEPVKQMKKISFNKAYCARSVLEIEAAGFQVLGDLIEFFIEAANDVALLGENASAKSMKLLQLIPSQYLAENREPDKNLYSRLLKITDFVSGMTDSYAVSLYKKISGISLPRG